MSPFDACAAADLAYQQAPTLQTALALVGALRRVGRVAPARALLLQWSAIAREPVAPAQLGCGMSTLGLFEQAERVLQEVLPSLSLPSEAYQIQMELAVVKSHLGKFDEVSRLLRSLDTPEWRVIWAMHASPGGHDWFLTHQHKCPRHDEPVAGKHVLILQDGGAGDLLQFLRYLERLLEDGAASVKWVAPQSLHGLLRHCGLPITILPESPLDVLMSDCDVFFSPFNLWLRYQPHPYFPACNAPYLALSTDYALPDGIGEKLLPHADRRPRVGLVWRSASAVRHEPFRSVSLHALAPLLEVMGAAFFSLQVGPLSEQEQELMTRHQIVDLGAHLRSFEDTAHVLEHLDLLISVDSAPAHLAGARNRPVWLMLSQTCDARWYNWRDHTPWYASMRLYRQVELGDWQPVLAEMTAALETFAPCSIAV